MPSMTRYAFHDMPSADAPKSAATVALIFWHHTFKYLKLPFIGQNRV